MTRYRRTPLHYAASEGHTGAVALLAAAGADLHAQVPARGEMGG